MMVKKLGGFFSIMGVMVFLGSWLYHRWFGESLGLKVMPPDKAWEIGIYMAVAFLCLGFFISTLGIALVQEVLAERRGREMERKYRAKSNYDMVINMEDDASGA